MNNVSKTYRQTQSGHAQNYSRNHRGILSSKCIAKYTLNKKTDTISTECFRVAKYCIIGICSLLVLLRGVSGSSNASASTEVDDSTLSVGGVLAEKIPFKSREACGVMQILASAEVHLSHACTSVYRLPQSSAPLNKSIFDSNLITQTCQYAVLFKDSPVAIGLPTYSDGEEAKMCLNRLSQIVVIRSTTNANTNIYVSHRAGGLGCHLVNLQILYRAINLLDCAAIELCFEDGWEEAMKNNALGFVAARQEARDTVAKTDYKFKCHLVFLSLRDNPMDLVYGSIILARQIAVITLNEKSLCYLHLLSKVRLADDFTLILLSLPQEGNVDLRFLQDIYIERVKIVINPWMAPTTQINFLGLENVIANRPKVVLEASWGVLRYLAEHSVSKIHVCTVLGLDIGHLFIRQITDNTRRDAPSEPKIIAKEIILTLSSELPCKQLNNYKQIFSQTIIAKYGISADEIHVKYGKCQQDFYKTLWTLYNIQSLPATVLNDLSWKGPNYIDCCGEELSNPTWKLPETVDIQLGNSLISRLTKEFSYDSNPIFCQNMRYSTIRITGTIGQASSQIQHLIYLLLRFQNLTADTLTISNVQPDNHIISTFDLKTLK
ncbi:hypothetical protein NEHOM01_2347, partial [Nematocida homosporus]|uniref:uncharacterized protein n=1 Tax=Nematocida homosporus TaxID=1912981 RepID=UPI00221F25B6